MKSAVVIIPARLASRRLPRKVLAEISGIPMVLHVMRRAALAQRVSRVVVATADEEIKRVVRDAGGRVVDTRSDHRSGSDRVAEAVQRLGLEDEDLVVNVQGDEPMLDPDIVDGIVHRLQQGARIVTAAAPLRDDPHDPATVKVVIDRDGRAIYFSRQAIPSGGPWLQHIGVYGFQCSELKRFSSLAPGLLEKAERLEQLRLLENGLAVHVIEVAQGCLSVDTSEDLSRARTMMSNRSQNTLPDSLHESPSPD